MKRTPPANTPELRAAAQKHLCSAWELDSTSFAWDNRWGVPMEAAAVGAFAGDDVLRPPTASIFQQARRWYRLHAFIRNVVHLKIGFGNAGLLGQRWVPVNPKKPQGDQRLEVHPGIRAEDPADAERVDKWKRANRDEITRVVQDVWHSYILLRNTVALWRKSGRVIIRPPEGCSFKDEFGVEVLSFKHGMNNQAIDDLPGLSKEERNRLKASTTLKLDHDNPTFFFRVLKDEPLGMGFGWPDLTTLFHACSLNESLLVGDRQLAEACRTVYEQHVLGHEIRSGLHAGSPAHFMKDVRAAAVTKQIKGKKGHVQIATNFDHVIKIGSGRPEANQFDTARYRQVAEQMATWGMPYGQMWTGGQINPFLMTLARTLAHGDRERMRPFLTDVLSEALHAPASLALQWDDACFWDSRLLLDLLKTGLAAGPVSQESFLRCTGFVATDERQAKGRDAALPKELVLPVFDPAHGKRPGDPAGKPAGKADQE